MRLNAIQMIDAQNGIIVGDGALILRTTDGGDTWMQQRINTSNNLYSLSFVDASRGVVVGEGGTIMGNVQGGLAVAVEDDHERNLPTEFSLAQNYPNPFNPATTIRYQLSLASFVSLRVFDVLGREVAGLVNQVQNAGYHQIMWNAFGLSSGVYICQMRVGTIVQTKTMMLVK
jgi:hypothetical protein